jgi:hexosaminidase
MYRDLVTDCLRKSLEPGLAWLKPVTLAQPPSEKYKVGGALALTDGKRGLPDYNFNWLGFEDAHLEAIIDLGEPKLIQSVSADFLQFTQAWIFLPTQVSVSYSNDGKAFKGEKTIKAFEKPDKTGSFVSSFVLNFKNVKTQYIKVKATSLLKCPDGHPGHGLPAWIFCDEIVVK